MNKLNISAEKALTSYFAVKTEEKILLIYDHSTSDIATAFEE